MNFLNVFVAVVFVFSFVISTTVLVIGYGDEWILPASLVRFVRDTGPEREFIRAGSRWWTALLFVALSIAALLVPITDAYSEVRSGDGANLAITGSTIVADAVWLGFLWSRRRNTSRRTNG